MNQVTYRGKTTTSLYDFKNTPTGALSFKDGSGVGVYYQDSRGAWKRDSFDTNGLYKQTDSLTINEVLTDEAIYDLDLDGDGNIGDTISAVYMNVPDADTGVENPKDNFGLYKTATGSYIADTADLAVGDYADSPTLLIKQTVSRGQTSTSLYNFSNTPTGAVAYAEGGGSVYYKDSRDNWFRDNFSDDGLFQSTDSLTLSEVRNEEAVHDLDLDGDGVVGDTIEAALANDGQGKGIFKTTSGSYIIDDGTLSVGDQTNDPTILTQEVAARRGPPTISLKEFEENITGFVSHNDKSLVYYRDKKNIWHKEEFSKEGVLENITKYNLSTLLNDESKYNIDLNNDGNIGDVITAVIGDNGSIGLYQTGSGSYLIDNSGLDIGDSSVSPTLLTQVVTARRGPATTSLYEFSNTPTGTVALTEGGFGVYYQTTGRNGVEWKRDSFDTNGLYKQTDSYSFTELLAEESTYNIDLNKDGSVGDVVAEVVINNAAKTSSLYKTLSGQYVVDNTGLSTGDSLVDPEILIVQKTFRGKTTETNYKPIYSLTGGIAYEDIGGGALYYQDARGNWFRDNFLADGIFQNKESLSFAQVLAHEVEHNVDLNGDTFIGNTVKLVLADDGNIGVY